MSMSTVTHRGDGSSTRHVQAQAQSRSKSRFAHAAYSATPMSMTRTTRESLWQKMRVWHAARLTPLSGASGAEEKELRTISALLAAMSFIKESGGPFSAHLNRPAYEPRVAND